MPTTLPTLLLSRHYTSRPMGNIDIGGVSSDVDVSQRTFGRRLRRVRTHGERSTLYLSKPSRLGMQQCYHGYRVHIQDFDRERFIPSIIRSCG